MIFVRPCWEVPKPWFYHDSSNGNTFLDIFCVQYPSALQIISHAIIYMFSFRRYSYGTWMTIPWSGSLRDTTTMWCPVSSLQTGLSWWRPPTTPGSLCGTPTPAQLFWSRGEMWPFVCLDGNCQYSQVLTYVLFELTFSNKSIISSSSHLFPPPSPIFAGGANDRWVRSVSFCHDGRHIASIADDRYVVWLVRINLKSVLPSVHLWCMWWDCRGSTSWLTLFLRLVTWSPEGLRDWLTLRQSSSTTHNTLLGFLSMVEYTNVFRVFVSQKKCQGKLATDAVSI